jgi:hypothetical protein
MPQQKTYFDPTNQNQEFVSKLAQPVLRASSTPSNPPIPPRYPVREQYILLLRAASDVVDHQRPSQR